MERQSTDEVSEPGENDFAGAGDGCDIASAVARLAPRYGFRCPVVVGAEPGARLALVAIVALADAVEPEAADERARRLLDEARRSVKVQPAPLDYRFTRAEKAVLVWLRLGRTNRDIGQILHKSEFTVKTHIQHMLAKTGLDNRLQLAGLPLEA